MTPLSAPEAACTVNPEDKVSIPKLEVYIVVIVKELDGAELLGFFMFPSWNKTPRPAVT